MNLRLTNFFELKLSLLRLIAVGSSESCFDALQKVMVFHYLGLAENVVLTINCKGFWGFGEIGRAHV